jgi:hypothetical protein
MGPGDEAEIINFSDEVYVDQPFTSDKSLLKAAIGKYYGDSTALFDAVYQSISDAAPRTGRKAVVAITDGGENYSYYHPWPSGLQDCCDLATSLNVPVYTIGLAGAGLDEPTIQALACAGGTYTWAATSDDLKKIYEGISERLANQVRIEYLSPYPYDTTPDTEREVWVYLTNYPPYTDSGDIEIYYTTYWK